MGICATYANNLSQEVAQCNQKRHLAEGIHFDISCAAQNLGWILSFFLIFNIIEENPTKEVGKTMSRHAQSQNQRRNMMLNEPISRIIPKMAVPTIVAFLINSVYSLADTYFVSSLGTTQQLPSASTLLWIS